MYLQSYLRGFFEEGSSPVSKSYHKYRVLGIRGGATAFALGLADFASLGFKRFDIAGYAYEDENEALYSDWVKLGQDIEKAKESIKSGISE
jgi:hypothetical protein